MGKLSLALTRNELFFAAAVNKSIGLSFNASYGSTVRSGHKWVLVVKINIIPIKNGVWAWCWSGCGQLMKREDSDEIGGRI